MSMSVLDVSRYCKAQLELENSSTKYFTKNVVASYINGCKTGDFSEVHKTKFYEKNSTSYCRMLEIIYDLKNKGRLCLDE